MKYMFVKINSSISWVAFLITTAGALVAAADEYRISKSNASAAAQNGILAPLSQ